MRQENPSAKFYDCKFIDQSGCTLCNNCPYMQLNNMEKLHHILKMHSQGKTINEINLDKDLAQKAKNSLVKMLEMS